MQDPADRTTIGAVVKKFLYMNGMLLLKDDNEQNDHSDQSCKECCDGGSLGTHTKAYYQYGVSANVYNVYDKGNYQREQCVAG